MPGKPANDNQACPSCGSARLEWERDNGWLTHGTRHLRCQSCGDAATSKVAPWTWVMFAIALAAAAWGWVVVAN